MRALILAPILLVAAAAGEAAVQGPNQSSGSAVLTLTAGGGTASGVTGSVTLDPARRAKAVPEDSRASATFGRIVVLPAAKTIRAAL